MIVDRMTPATSAWFKPGRTSPASTASSSTFSSSVTRGTKARAASVWCAVSSWWQNSAMTGVGLFFDGASLGRREAHAVVLHDEGVEPFEGRVLAGDLLFEPVRRREDRLVEEGEEQLVLAGEVLVEAAQGLAGAVHHLLDGELLAGLRPAQQLEAGVEEALDPSLAAEPGRVQGPRHGEVAPSDRFGGGGRTCRGIVD